MKPVFLLFLTLISFFCRASDTLFLRSLPLPERASNIDADGRRLLIRTNGSIIVLEKGELRKLDLPVERRFSWIVTRPEEDRVSVIHTSIPLHSREADSAAIAPIIPGFYTNFITAVRLGDYLYVCYRGQVLEYLIQENIHLRLRGVSVRHIYCNDSSRIISTYKGILKQGIDDGVFKRMSGTYYSSGELCEIADSLYLCQDGLFVLRNDTAFVRLTEEIDLGAFRKLISWKGKTWCMFTNRFSEFDLESRRDLSVSIKSETMNDAEAWHNNMYVCDSKGNLFVLNENGVVNDTVFFKHPVWDLHADDHLLYIGTDSALFTLDTLGRITELISSMQIIQVVNAESIIFISNNSGLYCYKAEKLFPIVEDVEFNHRALVIDNKQLYAGSIDGLYQLSIANFENEVLPRLRPIDLPERTEKTPLWKIVVIVGATTIAVSGVALIIQKRKKAVIDAESIPEKITPEVIEQIIRNNEKVISVQALAEHLDTSIVQLNRKLKSFGTTPLIAMQEAKKKLAREMHQAKEPIEKIARRTGYSTRYVKEHFLSDTEE